jgi:hypothetical protein
MEDLNKIIGWDSVLPQLVSFFAVLRRRPNGFTPFNLFLSGNPGTNKSEGALRLARALGYQAEIIDTSTLDDVAELAGVTDLRANRERGEASLIEGVFLKADVLVVDEFPNARPHVLPMFRLLLQGKYSLMGQPVEINCRCMIGTGNLQSEMVEGQANALDSPTADRFAMVVRVPSLTEMDADDAAAILEDRTSAKFADAFGRALEGTDRLFAQVEAEAGGRATRYVQSLVGSTKGTLFAFEGRRGKLLRQFVIAAMALCRAEPNMDLERTIWQVVRDVLSYHRLSGLELDLAQLESFHRIAYQNMGDVTVEGLIAGEPEPSKKIAILMANLAAVTAITKVSVLGEGLKSTNIGLVLAIKEIVASQLFEGQPSELRALVERAPLPFATRGVTLTSATLAKLAEMSAGERAAFELADGDESRAAALLAEMREHLDRWGAA